MNNQFQKFTKEIEKIPVPVEKLDKIISDTVYLHNIKKPKKKIFLYTVSAACLGFGLFIGSACLSPTMAEVASKIPVVGTFFNSSDDEGLRIAGQSGLTQVIDQTDKDNGYSLTINEIFYDGTRFTLGYTIESFLPIGEIERPNIEVNGELINFASGYSGKYITPLKYQGEIDINPTEELPEQFDMKMWIDAIGLIPGHWELEFAVKQSNKVTVIRPEEVKIIDGKEVTLETVKLGPAGTDLSLKVIYGKLEKTTEMFEVNVVDENGRALSILSGNGYGENKEITYSFLYSPIKKGTKRLRIVPYRIPFENGSVEDVSVKLNKKELPITLDQGEFGQIIITDIQNTDRKTIVYFKVENNHGFAFDDNLTRNMTWLEDKNGKKYGMQLETLAKRVEGNLFKQEFDTGKQEDLMFVASKLPKPIMYEEFIVEVP